MRKIFGGSQAQGDNYNAFQQLNEKIYAKRIQGIYGISAAADTRKSSQQLPERRHSTQRKNTGAPRDPYFNNQNVMAMGASPQKH